MSDLKCIICKYQSKDISNYKRHISSKKHINNINNSYSCKECDYITPIKVNYTRHLLSKKHLKNIGKNNNKDLDKDLDEDKNQELKKIIEVNNELRDEVKETRETINVLMNKMNTLENKNDQNTQKIVKEARNIKSSMLTMLNTHFKDTPSIEYIEQKPFFIELEKEYNAKISDESNKLFMRIFTDYEKKKLVKTLSDLILKFVKKDDKKFQSVFNIDCARGNFATKIDDFWLNDKKGLQLRKFTIDKVVSFMIDVLEVFRLRLVEIRKENIKNPTSERNDYLMENQTLLLEVVSFLTNSNTHTKIMTHLSPNLRCEKLLNLLE